MTIKKWFGNLVRDAMYASEEDTKDLIRKGEVSSMERMFGSANPAIVAFRIDNGYVVRTMDEHTAMVGGRVGGFTYCKDHAAIAEHIVGSEVKRKMLGESAQQEMFGQGVVAQSKVNAARAANRI